MGQDLPIAHAKVGGGGGAHADLVAADDEGGHDVGADMKQRYPGRIQRSRLTTHT